MTKEEAIALYESGWWLTLEPHEIAARVLWEERLICPFDVLHEAVEKALGRPVCIHEFAGAAGQERLQREFLKETPKATMAEILALIPPEKLVVLQVPGADQ